ncbi:MAG: phosphatidylserine decarboxylase [Candidatus Zixiibacteriota bacterium]|nr:MAG: phosphatidylserine decarboxylase [candidate division Zixibacteria bacterium]
MISPYGLKFIGIGLVLTAILVLWSASRDSLTLLVISIIVCILTLFLIYFYRNPIRNIPTDEDLILSVADGRVLSVVDIESDYIGGRGKKVSIFLSILDPHMNRIPTSGRLEYVKYVPGKFFKAFQDKASEENEHTEIGLAFGTSRIILKQIAGILARRIVCNLKPQQHVKAGEIFGLIHFGSRAELFLPENIEVLVKRGDRVKAGESLIGRIIRK